MTDATLPPWTDEQIAGLEAWQNCGHVHGFTCPNRGDGNHKLVYGDLGSLRPTRDGWVCESCDYTQQWAHAFMFQGAPPNPLLAFQRNDEPR